jgi:hypothetical protein
MRCAKRSSVWRPTPTAARTGRVGANICRVAFCAFFARFLTVLSLGLLCLLFRFFVFFVLSFPVSPEQCSIARYTQHTVAESGTPHDILRFTRCIFTMMSPVIVTVSRSLNEPIGQLRFFFDRFLFVLFFIRNPIAELVLCSSAQNHHTLCCRNNFNFFALP